LQFFFDQQKISPRTDVSTAQKIIKLSNLRKFPIAMPTIKHNKQIKNTFDLYLNMFIINVIAREASGRNVAISTAKT